MRHEIVLTLDDETETYRGTFDGQECYSDPDRIGIRFGETWRTLGWNTSHLQATGGDVCKALIYLWGVNHKG